MIMVGGLYLMFLSTLGGISHLRDRLQWHPEITRKIIHLSLGGVCLSFPWIFTQFLDVLILCSLCLSTMFIIRFTDHFKKQLGDGIYGISRQSLGEIYFTVSVALCFYWANGKTLLYFIPILILTFSDLAAALIGTFYAKCPYKIVGGQKSLEGSITFFWVTFTFLLISIMLLSDLEKEEYKFLGIAFLLTSVVTIVEAVSWKGLDNLFIPLSLLIMMDRFVGWSLSKIGIYTGLLWGFFLLTMGLHKKSGLDIQSLLCGVIFAFFFICAESPFWAYPLAALFILYALFSEQHPLSDQNLWPVLSICSSGLVWVLLDDIFDHHIFAYAFFLSFAIHGFLILNSFLSKVFLPLLTIIVPFLIYEQTSLPFFFLMLINAFLCILISHFFLIYTRSFNTPWVKNALIAFVGSSLGIGMILLFRKVQIS